MRGRRFRYDIELKAAAFILLSLFVGQLCILDDYYLSRNLKSHLGGTRFRDDNELKNAAETWFNDQTEEFYVKCMKCLKEKWTQHIEIRGDHIEK